MATGKKLRDYEVNDMRGTYQLKWKSDDGSSQIWVTSGNRYTVMDTDLDMVVKSNIRDVESAKSHCEGARGETTELERSKIKNTHRPYRIEKKNDEVKNRKIGDTCFGGWICLGGGRKYNVWMSPTGMTFQVVTRCPEIAVTQAISQDKLHLFLNRKYDTEGEETPYQMPLPFNQLAIVSNN